MEIAENAASDPKNKDCEEKFEFYDAKEMLENNEQPPATEPPAFNDRSLEPINYTIPKIVLTENRNFFNYRVNTSNCSVHVPTNVFARGKLYNIYRQKKKQQNQLIFLVSYMCVCVCHFDIFPLPFILSACSVIKEVKWSKELDIPFLDNYKKDPTFSWQFFCSSTGVMRQFPGNKVFDKKKN